MSRITSNSSGGTVSIRDTGGNTLTSTNGALNVNVTGAAGGSPAVVYNEVTSVAQGATVTVLTYTVPIGDQFNMNNVLVSSDSIGIIQLLVDSVVVAKYYLTYGVYNVTIPYSFSLVAGRVVQVVATNNSTQGVSSVNATLLGVLE